MIEIAELIAAFPDDEDRRRESRRHVYVAMYESAGGRLTAAERGRILDILRPCCPELFEAAARMLPPPGEFQSKSLVRFPEREFAAGPHLLP